MDVQTVFFPALTTICSLLCGRTAYHFPQNKPLLIKHLNALFILEMTQCTVHSPTRNCLSLFSKQASLINVCEETLFWKWHSVQLILLLETTYHFLQNKPVLVMCVKTLYSGNHILWSSFYRRVFVIYVSDNLLFQCWQIFYVLLVHILCLCVLQDNEAERNIKHEEQNYQYVKEETLHNEILISEVRWSFRLFSFCKSTEELSFIMVYN